MELPRVQANVRNISNIKKYRGQLFDCHNHTWHSHDSQCNPDELCRCAIEKGLTGIAFTDHCDIEFVNKIDIKSEIRNSVKDSVRYNQIYADQLKILTGIEMGEAMWHPSEAKRILSMEKYDIVLGSVHAVRSRLDRSPYSGIFFSKFTMKQNLPCSQKSANFPYQAFKCFFELNLQAYALATGISQPSAFNFLRYAFIFRSLLN